MWGGIAIPKWQRTRSDHGPSTFFHCQPIASFPRHVATCLPARMRDLETDLLSLAVDESHDPRQRLNVIVLPHSQASRRNTTIGLNSSGLDQDQCHAATCSTAEMDEVPVIRETIRGNILAHRGHHDSVGQRQPPKLHRSE